MVTSKRENARNAGVPCSWSRMLVVGRSSTVTFQTELVRGVDSANEFDCKFRFIENYPGNSERKMFCSKRFVR